MRRVAATSRAAGSALLVALASLVMLSGCVPDDSPPAPPQTTATAAPVFASEEEALAAATEAVQKYLAVSDQVAQDGGNDPSRFAEVVTAEWLPQEEKSAEFLRTEGLKQVGVSTFELASLQQWDQEPDSVSIVLYLCFDLSTTDLVKLDGSPSSVETTDSTVPVEVAVAAITPSPLRVERISPWSGDDFCNG